MWLLWKQEIRPDGKQIISFMSDVRCTEESEDMIGNKDIAAEDCMLFCRHRTRQLRGRCDVSSGIARLKILWADIRELSGVFSVYKSTVIF